MALYYTVQKAPALLYSDSDEFRRVRIRISRCAAPSWRARAARA